MARLGRSYPAPPVIKRQRFSAGNSFSQTINATSVVLAAKNSKITARSALASLSASNAAALGTGRGTSSANSSNYLQQSSGISLLSASNGPFTIAFWFKSGDITQTNTYLIEEGAADQWAIIYGFAANLVEFFAVPFGGSDPRAGTASGILISDTNWHHIAYRKAASGASAWDYFLDGVKTSISSSINFTLPTISTSELTLFNADNFAAPVKAGLGDLSVYTSALSDAQVQSLAVGNHPSGSPAAYFPLFGSQSPELDAAGNGYSLTVNGSVPQVSGPPYINSATVGTFSGTNIRTSGKTPNANLLPINAGLGGRASIRAITSAIPTVSGSVKRSISRATASVASAFSATFSSVKSGGAFVFSVAASLLTLGAASVRRTSQTKPAADSALGASVSKVTSHSATASIQPFSGLATRMFARALAAVTLAMNAAIGKQRNTNQAGSTVGLSASRGSSTSKSRSASSSLFTGSRGSAIARSGTATANPASGSASRLISRTLAAVGSAFSATLSATKNAVTHTFTVAASLLAMAAVTLRSESRSSNSSTTASTGKTARATSDSRTGTTAASSATDSQSITKNASASPGLFQATASRQTAHSASAKQQPASATTGRLIGLVGTAVTAAFAGILTAAISGVHILVFAASMLTASVTTRRAMARTAAATSAPQSSSIAKRISHAFVSSINVLRGLFNAIRGTRVPVAPISLSGQSGESASLSGMSTVRNDLTGEAGSADDLTGQQ